MEYKKLQRLNMEVATYDDYRQYLLDLKTIIGISYESFTKDLLGFKTKSFIIEVIQGKKNLGVKSAINVGIALNFDLFNHAHFIDLVVRNDIHPRGVLLK